MKALVAALALATLIAVPTFTQPANAARCPRRAPHLGLTATDRRQNSISSRRLDQASRRELFYLQNGQPSASRAPVSAP